MIKKSIQINYQEEALYNNILSLSRNKLFYTKLSLIDTFQNRIYLIFFHLSFILIVLKNKESEKNNQQDIFCIVICGTGIGVSISCNKYKDIRCALCHNKYTAEMAKKHNNANVIAMGGRILNIETAIDIINTFINTQYEGGRHQRRLDKIEKLVIE